MKEYSIEAVTEDPVINLAVDTISKGKQALVFCNTKRGAESQAEKIAKKLPLNKNLKILSEKALNVLSTPTKQCIRLANCLKKGVAFHHAGLNYKQRELVEDYFRSGDIKIICSTPTLAMGLDLPAFRTIIRDTKRFGGASWGLSFIPVLEYEQISGRAGRPGKESYGESIMVASSDSEAEELIERFILGNPEPIFSKLAVEPVLRTYLLSLIATGFIHDENSMFSFFDKSFYAFQYSDLSELHKILNRMLSLLISWGFVEGGPKKIRSDFEDASSLMKEGSHDRSQAVNNRFRPTRLGIRIAQLYLDPLTAFFIIKHLKKTSTPNKSDINDIALLHLLCSTLEMRPLFRPRTKDYEIIEEVLAKNDLLVSEPVRYGYEYDEFLASLKTAMVLNEWINEAGEDYIFSSMGVRPGELQAKIDRADWLLYACEELSKIIGFKILSDLSRMRVRLKYGVKEELLALLKIKGIGRVRARALFRNGIKNIKDVKKIPLSSLASLIGPKIATSVKETVGEKIVSVDRRKRKGQKNLADWD